MDIITVLDLLTEEYNLAKRKAVAELQSYANCPNHEVQCSPEGKDEWDTFKRIRMLVGAIATAENNIRTIEALKPAPAPTQEPTSESS